MAIREATGEDRLAVRRLLDAAALSVPPLPPRLADGDVLLAEREDRAVGTLVLVSPRDAPAWAREAETDGHVAAIAVRRPRRGRGIGTALLERAGERGRLTAAFDADLLELYRGAGFDVLDRADGRSRAVRPAD